MQPAPVTNTFSRTEGVRLQELPLYIIHVSVVSVAWAHHGLNIRKCGKVRDIWTDINNIHTAVFLESEAFSSLYLD